MRKSWLLFSQAVTVAVAVLFVVATLKPEWVRRGNGAPLPNVVTISTAPAVPVPLTSGGAVMSYAAAAKQLDFAGARRLSYLLAFVRGDSATMARELEASLGAGETNAAGWQATSQTTDATRTDLKVRSDHPTLTSPPKQNTIPS